MTYETEAFTDIARLSTRTGLVPAEIPHHYWRFTWSMRRKAMHNKVPMVDWRSAAVLSKPIRLGYTAPEATK